MKKLIWYAIAMVILIIGYQFFPVEYRNYLFWPLFILTSLFATLHLMDNIRFLKALANGEIKISESEFQGIIDKVKQEEEEKKRKKNMHDNAKKRNK